ncbi:MAG: lactonase family protein [Thermomicrobiales bacterium]
MLVYVGAYTEPAYGHAAGIDLFDFDPATGELRHLRTMAGVPNPSFLALNADRTRLYAVNELPEGRVSAFARDRERGELHPLNSQLAHGADPCYVSLDPSGRFVLVANYTGGTIAVLPIAADGALEPASCVIHHDGSGPRPEQEGAHPHMIAPTPDGQRVLVSDLGADRLVVYRLVAERGTLVSDASGTDRIAAAAGAGPRHFAFAPDGETLYVINELDSTLSVYRYDANAGTIASVQTVPTLPGGFDGANSCAHVVVSPDGRFVYGSNRGHDSIAIWSAGESGAVTALGHEPTRGRTPRGFALDPTGTWLLVANQESDSLVTFRRDPETGLLTASGSVVDTPSPVAVLFCAGS